jgi:4-nitrophenyl phosphatase
VYTSAQAAAQYIAEQRLGTKVYRIGEQGLDIALTEAGLSLCEEEEVPDVVVQGIDRAFTYDKLQQAVTYILDGAHYVLTNPDLLLPSDHGLSPGAGTIGAAIQAGSGVKPTVIGKPSSIIMNYALQKLRCEAAETAVIGDNLFTDIGAGKAAGCKTFLVLTGVTTTSNISELSTQDGYEADLVFDDLKALSVYIHQTIRQ